MSAFCDADAMKPAEYLYVGSCGGDGILIFQWLPGKRELRPVGREPSCRNPSCFARNPRLPVLYAADESVGGAWIAAYEMSCRDGRLRHLGTAGLSGSQTCHLEVLPDADMIAASHYDSGSIVFCAIRPRGEVGEELRSIQHEGFGPRPQQERAHLHQAIVTPDGKRILGVDLGADYFAVYPLMKGTPPCPRDARKIRTEEGEGPRHMRFHPNGLYAYLVTELGNRLYAYRYDAPTGDFALRQVYDLLPKQEEKVSFAADLRFSVDGRFLYVSVRGCDFILRYCVNAEDGSLTEPLRFPSYGAFPRMLALDRAGECLFVANQKSDTVAALPIDRHTGALSPPCALIRCGRPCAVFTAVMP